jgi:hypothetical protein
MRTVRTSSVILAIAVLGAAAGTASAQGRGRGKQNDNVPPGQRPPAGMCRIWIDGVPPGHQPAPTNCETAVRNQPPNSRIIWGDNTARHRNVYDDRSDRGERRDGDGNYRRDANGNVYDPSCMDNNRDGWCDYHPDVRSGIRTRDNSGHTGYPRDGYPGSLGGGTIDRGQYPSQMPAMTGATLIRVGVRTVDVQNWLGRAHSVPRRWTTTAMAFQKWPPGMTATAPSCRSGDDDRDGRADAVEIYQNGSASR